MIEYLATRLTYNQTIAISSRIMYTMRKILVLVICVFFTYVLYNASDTSINNTHYSRKINNHRTTSILTSTNSHDVFVREDLTEKCKKESSVIIIITSARDHVHERRSIRNTWCSKDMKTNSMEYNRKLWSYILKKTDILHNSTFQCYFLIGASPKKEMNHILINEAMKHNDLIMGTYPDNYHNLTNKVLNGLLWVHQYCGEDVFVLKTDDDCFVNVLLLLPFLYLHPQQYMYSGHVQSELNERQVVRTRNKKWSVRREDYEPDNYPPYVSGFGYILSSDTISELLRQVAQVPVFSNEDAYIGVLAQHAGIKPQFNARFTVYIPGWVLKNYCYLLILHQVKMNMQAVLLNYTKNAIEQCDTTSTIWD